MPDDLSDLMPEFERNLARANGDPMPEEEPEPAPLPRAMVNIPLITTLWIRWLPLSIMFFGMSFVAWTVVMIVQVGRYHDALTEVKQKMKVIERRLDEVQKVHTPERP